MINVKVEFGEDVGKVPLDNIAKRAEAYKPKERVTYKMIKEYIEAKYGFKVHTAYIAEVKYEKVFQLVCRMIMGQRDFEELRKYYDAGDWFNFDIFFEGAEATVKGY